MALKKEKSFGRKSRSMNETRNGGHMRRSGGNEESAGYGAGMERRKTTKQGNRAVGRKERNKPGMRKKSAGGTEISEKRGKYDEMQEMPGKSNGNNLSNMSGRRKKTAGMQEKADNREKRGSVPFIGGSNGFETYDYDLAEAVDELYRLEGRNPVLEALESGRSINRLYLAKGNREGSINRIISLARQKHVVIREIERERMDAMSGTRAHQGVIALVAAKDYVEVDDILEKALKEGKPPFIVILDGITDAYNLGAILRTSEAAGVHGVIIPKRRAIGLTAAVSKASAGAVEHVPVARVTNIVQTVEYLKKQNIWIAGTDPTGGKPYFKSDLTGPIALVVGSEGEGMGRLVRESCDFVVNIPMAGHMTSLNAAVAGAIVIYEILRQRSMKEV